MDKPEALAVVHEILDACRESVIITCVSLDPRAQIKRCENDRYLIRMKCDLDRISRDCIKPVLEKHHLQIREQNGYVTLCKD